MILGREITERVFELFHHLHASVIAQGFELFKNHGRRCYAFLRNVQPEPMCQGYRHFLRQQAADRPDVLQLQGQSCICCAIEPWPRLVCFTNLPLRNHDA